MPVTQPRSAGTHTIVGQSRLPDKCTTMGRIDHFYRQLCARIRVQRAVSVYHFHDGVTVAIAVTRLHHGHRGLNGRHKGPAAGGFAAVVRYQKQRGLQTTHAVGSGHAGDQRCLLRSLNIARQQGALAPTRDTQHARQGVGLGRRHRRVVLGAGVQNLKMHAVPIPRLPGLAALGVAAHRQRMVEGQ